jgi:hypothetical protein
VLPEDRKYMGGNLGDLICTLNEVRSFINRVTTAEALTASVQPRAHSSASLVTVSPIPTNNPTHASGAPEHILDTFTWSLNLGL